MEDVQVQGIVGAELYRAVMAVERSAAKEVGRPVLEGVNVEIGSGEAIFAAADGFRLSVSNAGISGEVEASAILERAQLVACAKQFKKEPLVEIVPEEGTWTFRAKQNSFGVRTIDGTFPDWRTIMPKEDDLTSVANINPKFIADAGSVSVSAPVVQIFQSADGEPNKPVLLLSKNGGKDGEVFSRHLIMPMVFGAR